MAVRVRLVVVLALAASATLAYARNLSAPPVLDDQLTIFENPQIRDWRSSSVLFPERELPVAGRPLVNASLAVNYAFGQTALTGYRLVNLALHVLCAITLFGVVRRWMARVGQAGGVKAYGRDNSWTSSPDFLASAVALIWL